MKATSSLILISKLYCEAVGRSQSRVSTLVFNDGKTIRRVADGGDVSTRSYERAMQWFSDNWPEGASWPDGVERPAPTEAREAV